MRKARLQVWKKEMEASMIIRKHIRFYGQVQGVGFRYRSYYSALSLGLTGWVQNDWDGSVEMEVQDLEETIDRLLVMLHSERFISIDYFEQNTIPVIDKERKFKVR